VIIFCAGCDQARIPLNNSRFLIAKSLPPFPHPSPLVADDLVEACPNHKCVALYEWIGKLKILQAQLDLYKELTDE
jgi:hypothetical protein